jgi:molybdopterin-guanine dinucleotide biosynthesis protein A
LCAFYRNSALAAIESALDRGQRKVTAIYQGLRVRAVNESILRPVDQELVSFINLNTPRELSYLEELNTRLNRGALHPVDIASCTQSNAHHST